MRKIVTILALCFSLQNFAQENTTIKTDSLLSSKNNENKLRVPHFDAVWRIYYASPNQFGNTVWNDAYNSGFSMGTSLAILEFRKLRLSGAYEIERHAVENVSLAGNFERITQHNFHGSISYDFRISNRIMIVPNIGIGTKGTYHRMKSERIAYQSGNTVRIGAFFDYSLGKSVSAFLGIHYIGTKFDVKINNEYQDYFEKSRQLQLTVGLKVY